MFTIGKSTVSQVLHNDGFQTKQLTRNGDNVHTIGLIWDDNKVNISNIPDGTYTAYLRDDGSKGKRIELRNVPDRDKIQVHVGNDYTDSEGCEMGGHLDVEKLNISGEAYVTDSRKCVDLMYHLMLSQYGKDDFPIRFTGTPHPAKIVHEPVGTFEQRLKRRMTPLFRSLELGALAIFIYLLTDD